MRHNTPIGAFQRRVLRALALDTMTANALTERIASQQGQVYRALLALEERKLVKRSTREREVQWGPRRINFWTITDNGRDELARGSSR